jgi:hypothetical protein
VQVVSRWAWATAAAWRGDEAIEVDNERREGVKGVATVADEVGSVLQGVKVCCDDELGEDGEVR